MSGHLFVLRGDLALLRCDAVLIPCDHRWNVTWRYWSRLLPRQQFEQHPSVAEWRRFTGATDNDHFVDVFTRGERRVRLVVTVGGRRRGDAATQARWVADMTVESIADLAERRRGNHRSGRVKPLIGLPLVGTGGGGFETTRGVLIDALLPQLRDAARDCDVDIALVLNDDRDHAAVQAVRDHPAYWTGFGRWQPDGADEKVASALPTPERQRGIADGLGRRAAHGQLSLFLGSGVSVPLGLPDWRILLSDIDDPKNPAFDPRDTFDPRDAPRIAQRIEKKLGRTTLHQKIAERLKVRGYAPTHLLLAALAVRQTVTTNYDTAYEQALTSNLGAKKFRVLTRQIALQPHPWVLKFHGCVKRPDTIVISEDDYARLQRDYGALQAVIESLMLTSHLMFVGFSMADLDFNAAAEKVRKVRARAEDPKLPPVATVLALHPDAVESQDDFEMVPMLGDKDDPAAARLLEIFLDRVSWSATAHGAASDSYLLHPRYQALFAGDPAAMQLRELLDPLVEAVASKDPESPGRWWNHVEDLLARLGARRDDNRL